MRTVPVALQTELNGTTSKPVRLVKITRRSGTIVRFCEAQTALTVDSQTWQAGRGIRLSNITFELNKSTATLDIEIAVEDGGLLDPDDVRNGLYDFAEIVVYAASHGTPANGLVEMWRGYFGQTELTDRGMARVQAIDLLQKAREIPVEHYSPTCRVSGFGDTRCKFSLASVTLTRTITNVSGFNVTVSGASLAAHYRLGLLKPTSGGSIGEGFEIRSVSGTVLKMYVPPRGKLAIGDTVEITPGCDRTLAGTQGCKYWGGVEGSVPNRVVNFRAEPHVPGADALAVTYQSWGA
jgi:uncharacterized phage protein (TIGR02218 family)